MKSKQGATEYVQHVLSNGNTLAHELLAFLDFSKGDFFTSFKGSPLPPHFDDFKTGGKVVSSDNFCVSLNKDPKSEAIIESRPNSYLWLLEEIQVFLSQESGRIVVFENHVAHPSDPCVKDFDFPFWVFREELIHYLTGKDTRLPTIFDCIKQAYTWQFICLFSELSSSFIVPQGKCNEEMIENLRIGTKRVIVGAFDGEGFLGWKNSKDRGKV